MKEATQGFDDLEMMDTNYSASQLKKLGMEMNLIIEMPSKAKSHLGEVEGNKVTIDLIELLMSGEHKDIVVSSAKDESTNPAVWVIGGSSNCRCYDWSNAYAQE